MEYPVITDTRSRWCSLFHRRHHAEVTAMFWADVEGTNPVAVAHGWQCQKCGRSHVRAIWKRANPKDGDA